MNSDPIPAIIKITPSVDELTRPSQVPCTIPDCQSVFLNAGQLAMHLTRHHKLTDPIASCRQQVSAFYCPHLSCKYHASGTQCFRSMKHLRQHFMKVHAEKCHACPKCSARFASKALLNVHSAQCGCLFQCGTCRWTYKSHESLTTHCRRKRHQMPDHLRATVKKSSVESVEKSTDVLPTRTQTTQTTQCGSGTDLDATVFLDTWQRRASESSAVCPMATESESTNPFTTTNCSVQTEVNLNHHSFMGTQTDFSGGGPLSPMLFTADTQTQTQCDELMFGWTHIETQTCWSPTRQTPDFSDLLISAETQTTGDLELLIDRSNTQTQTTTEDGEGLI